MKWLKHQKNNFKEKLINTLRDINETEIFSNDISDVVREDIEKAQ